MTMFTSSEQKNLTKLLSTATNQDKVMTLAELHGYLFGLAISPEMLMPSQWTPAIFGGEDMCEIDDEKEGERLIGSLLSSYNRINMDCRNGKLFFPFDINNRSEEYIGYVRKWSRGLIQVLSKSKMLMSHYDNARNNGKVPRIDNESFAVSYCILRAVAHPEKTPELLERIQKGVKSDAVDVSSQISDSNFISMLPEAVISIREYALAVQDSVNKAEIQPKSLIPSSPIRAEKIGRNAPCSCGSGKKYKKCCGN